MFNASEADSPSLASSATNAANKRPSLFARFLEPENKDAGGNLGDESVSADMEFSESPVNSGKFDAASDSPAFHAIPTPLQPQSTAKNDESKHSRPKLSFSMLGK